MSRRTCRQFGIDSASVVTLHRFLTVAAPRPNGRRETQLSAETVLHEFEVWDGRLHEAIALAAHNSLVTQVFQLINRARDQDD